MKHFNQHMTRFSIVLFSGTLAFGTFVVAVVALEVFFASKKPLEFPFHNILYPYVEFRPPSNITWHSDRPSPSSRTGEFAVEYTNRDALRIPSPDYTLDREKPAVCFVRKVCRFDISRLPRQRYAAITPVRILLPCSNGAVGSLYGPSWGVQPGALGFPGV